MTVYIYGLRCPISGEIRYIGKSVNPKRRLKAHISAAVNRAYDHHTARWIRKLISADRNPALEVLHTVADNEDWRECERKIIAEHIDAGASLTNSTAGGEGLDYINPEDKERYLSNLQAAMTEYRATNAGKRQLAKMISAANEPEVIARRNVSIKKHHETAEYRVRQSGVATEINARPEVKAAKSAASKAMWQDDDKRAHFLEVFSSDETKGKQSVKRIAAWADPVVGAKLRAIHSSEEVRKKKSDAAIRRATPEYRAMMSEKRRLAWQRKRDKEKEAAT